MTALLERSNVVDLLDDNKVVTQNERILEALEKFYNENPYAEIIIQDDGDKFGIMIDAYEGENNVDCEIFYFDDYLPF